MSLTHSNQPQYISQIRQQYSTSQPPSSFTKWIVCRSPDRLPGTYQVRLWQRSQHTGKDSPSIFDTGMTVVDWATS